MLSASLSQQTRFGRSPRSKPAGRCRPLFLPLSLCVFLLSHTHPGGRFWFILPLRVSASGPPEGKNGEGVAPHTRWRASLSWSSPVLRAARGRAPAFLPALIGGRTSRRAPVIGWLVVNNAWSPASGLGRRLAAGRRDQMESVAYRPSLDLNGISKFMHLDGPQQTASHILKLLGFFQILAP